MRPVKRMQIDWWSSFYHSPYGGVTVLSPTKFTWEEGKKFLTLKRLDRYRRFCNRSMNEHWQMPTPIKVIPIKTKEDNKKCYFNNEPGRGPHYAIPYYIVLDWENEYAPQKHQKLQKYGGIDISTNAKGKLNVDMEPDSNPPIEDLI